MDDSDDAIELHGMTPKLPAGGGAHTVRGGAPPAPVFSFERQRDAPRDNLGVGGEPLETGHTAVGVRCKKFLKRNKNVNVVRYTPSRATTKQPPREATIGADPLSMGQGGGARPDKQTSSAHGAPSRGGTHTDFFCCLFIF